MSRPAALLAILVALVAVGCPDPQTPPPAPSAHTPAPAPVTWQASKSGLGFRLADADARDDHPAPRPSARPLSDVDTQRVLGRLPALTAEPGDTQALALRADTAPPPRPGRTVVESFPPPPAPAPPPPSVAAGAPLTVTRRTPEGAVNLAPYLSVSFSAPMVAVTAIDDLARTPPPVVLTPTPPGKWRWVGAQAVVFDPDKRFPMATEFHVEVPAGTRAANGQTLAAAVAWTFTTPPPKLVHSYPNHGPVDLDPVMFAELDQAIDPAALLRAVEVRGNGAAVPVRAATDAEIAADPVVRRRSDKAQPGRWLAFKATAPLARGATYEVRFPPGTPSTEGPRVTTKEERFGFSTYRPLVLERSYCAASRCAPGTPLRLGFNNALDTDRFDRSWIRVSPEPEALAITASEREIEIRGRTRGQTKYTVTVAGALADVHEQTLGAEATADFSITRAEPLLFAEESAMSVLEPQGGPALPVLSINRPQLEVKLYAVEPADWPRYQAWREAWDHDFKITPPPGRLVATRTVKTARAPDELTATPIDLGPALHDGLGQVLAVVEVPGPIPEPRWKRQWVRTWVQVTRLGVEAFTDDDTVVAWTTRLADGAPLAGVDVSVTPFDALGALNLPLHPTASGADGLARLTLGSNDPSVLLARQGADLAMLTGSNAEGFSRQHRADAVRWLLVDDRHLYKPGEDLHVKGWLRRMGMGRGGDVDALPAAAGRVVSWRVHDAQNVELGKGTATLDADAGFDVAFKLPPTPNLGVASIGFTLDGLPELVDRSAAHTFDIEEIRRPEFEVSARVSGGPFLVGDHATVTAAATYYAGGGLVGADVHWQARRADVRFVPPNRGAYAFGKSQEVSWLSRALPAWRAPEPWTGRTDAHGEHGLRVDFDAVDPPYPMALSFDASITDVNRQAWSAHADVLVHPAEVYVGLKPDRAFVKAGDALAVDVLVTDLEGRAVPGREVTVRSARLGWAYRRGEYVEIESDPDTCAITSTAEAARCALKTKEGGRYRVTAVVTDAHGRRNQTDTRLWVLGDQSPIDGTLPAGEVQIIPAKESYRPGETAELLILAPFAPAEGLLVLDRQGVVHASRFTLASKAETLRVPIDAAWTPNVTAHVALVGATVREDAHGVPDRRLPPRPAHAAGSVTLKIPPTERRLDVKATPRAAKLSPGGATAVDVEVRDAAGAAVAGSSVAVMIVDEAVLALSAYATPDPMAFFYADRGARARRSGLRESVLSARTDFPLDVASPHKRARVDVRASEISTELGSLDMTMLGALAAPHGPPIVDVGSSSSVALPERITVRKDFAALALFAPALVTDAAGRVSVDVKLPDSLTRYRVMALAAAGERRFGAAEASLTARLPLMVRPSAPRFLNYGDRFELPVVLQNQTDAPLEVDLAARAANAQLTDGAGRRVTVPANDRVEVRLPAAAAAPGKARFQLGAASGAWTDAAEVTLPVWTPGTTEAFATYGALDEGAVAQPVTMPSAVAPGFGGVEITTSSTALSALTDAVLYLVRYPYECNEQVASRVMAVAALRDVLDALATKDLPSKAELMASVARDVEKLRAGQLRSGGWGFWAGDREAFPFLSVHVAHALARAREKGFAVPQATLDRALGYLRRIDQVLVDWYDKDSQRALVAYALHARKRLGDADPARARRLVEESGGAAKLPLEALGWVWPTLADDARSANLVADLRRVVANRATETAGAAHFTTSTTDGAYVLLHSDRRVDGVMLEALIGDQPKSDLIPKLVTGLLAHRNAGRWASTQENAFVLLALDRYFSTYEKATPDFVARAWLGARYAGEHAFKGRSGDRAEIDVPMGALAGVDRADVVLEKTGPGRLYYRVGMTYAPADLRPPPVEHGFTVTRAYESVDDPADVRRDADGTWRVKAGARVRVRVTMLAPARRYHVALVDPLPAGLEVMNPALAVTGPVPPDPRVEPFGSTPWWWHSTWYDHQNLRDERVEAFASLLWDGVYDYTYVARATTPGSFVVPPPKAEEMYSPETFGRGAGDRLVVE